LKILWASNAPWAPSGYGTQTLQVVRRLRADGHKVAIAANFGIQARMMTDDLLPDVPILPALYDGIGNDILPAHYQFWKNAGGDEPTRLITLYDVWPYQRERFRDIPISSWVPVDHYPLTTAVAEWCKEHDVIAMSRYGQERFTVAGIDSTYIPHAIERVYRPIDDAREALAWEPDAFYVLINAANKGATPMRKAWSEMFGALAMFMHAHPDVRLHLHTERIGANSPDLQQIIDSWLLPSDRIGWTPQYALKTGQVDQEDVARLYSASDVLLATSKGEGFGLPVIEAQACGLPVIVSNWTAQPELVGGGWVADVQPDFDVGQGGFFCTPIISSILARLEDAYAARQDAERWADLRAKAIAKAAEYDADKVFDEYWRPYIVRTEDRPTRQQRRATRRKKAA